MGKRGPHVDDLFDLSGRVAMITGGAQNLGLDMAEALGEAGADLAITSRVAEKAEAMARELADDVGVQVLGLGMDVTDEASVIALFEQTVAEFGRIDILINNSGTFDGGPFEELSLATWQKVIDVNLTGPFLCAREAMKIMKRQGGGRIINMGSISA